MTAYYKGFITGKISIISPIGNTWSIITLALTVLLLSKSINAPELFCAALIILGTVLASLNLKEIKKLNKRAITKGAEYAILAAICFGVGYFFLNFAIQILGYFIAIALFVIFMVFYSGVYALLLGGNTKRSKTKLVYPIMALLVIGVLEAIGFISYGAGASINPVIIAPIIAASPIATILLALAI
jgi:uncharacterized membrane protein